MDKIKFKFTLFVSLELLKIIQILYYNLRYLIYYVKTLLILS